MEEISPTPETSDPLELARNVDEKAEENSENGGIAKILDKRIVDDRETWYLVNWADKKRENSWLESSEIEASQTAAIERFEKELAEKDPDEEFTLEKITDKRILSGVVYYYCKWLGFPDSDSTWEPCENIFAKNLIDDFEKEAENSKSAKKRKKSARQNDEDFTPEEDIVAGRAKRRRPVRNSTRVTPPLELVSDAQEQRKSRKKGALSEASELDEPESQVDTQLDEMYSLIGTRVPPCSYDSSDFEDGHKFSVRMSNYLSWLVVEHHICVYEQFKSYTRQERQTALEKRLKQYSMSDAIVELILSRENGIWDAVTCMNLDKRKMETIRMRRFIRDNETIPLPLDWPIMKFVAHIEMLRSRSFENAQETTKYVKSRTKARRPGRRKKRQPPKPKSKSLSDELEEELDPPQNDSLADAWNSRDPEGEEILPEIEEGAQNSEETASSKKNQPLNEEKSDSANPQEPSLFQTNQQMTESESPADIFEEISKELDLVTDGPSSNSAEENPNLPTVQVSELILTNQ